jgi:simple sugar transport system permease protein
MNLRALWPSDGHLRILISIFVVIALVLSVVEPNFRQTANLTSMALQVSDLGVLTLAMTLAMVVAGIDLSVVAVANLAAVIGTSVMQAMGGQNAGPGAAAVGALVMLAVGVLAGLGNGALIGYLRVPPILATLATMTLWSGTATALTGGVSLSGVPTSLANLGSLALAGVPVPVIILIAVIVLVWLLLNHTPLGLKSYLLGANYRASLFSGVDNARVGLTVYTTSGLLAAVAGLISVMRTYSASPSYGSSYVLLAILIAVLGGVPVNGGSGRVSGVVLALVTLQMLAAGFNMLLVGHGNSNFFENFAWGLLLLIVVSAGRVGLLRRGRRPSRQARGAGEGSA